MKQKDKDMMTSERERKTENTRQTIERKNIYRENQTNWMENIGSEQKEGQQGLQKLIKQQFTFCQVNN